MHEQERVNLFSPFFVFLVDETLKLGDTLYTPTGNGAKAMIKQATTVQQEVFSMTLVNAMFYAGNMSVSQRTNGNAMDFYFADGSSLRLINWMGNHPAGREFTTTTQDHAA